MKRPTVDEFESLSTGAQRVKGFWSNKVTWILLVVLLANIGSSLGTFIGGTDIIHLFLEVF